jgi:ABC-type amino acid transport substrate-binding protein
MTITRRAALALGLSVLALPALAQDPIRIGIDASYAPFGFVDESGAMTGFDVDISNALCAEMKATCEIVNLPWDGIFAALEAGNIDAVITSVNITDERKQKYEMVGPYYQSPMAWMAAPGSEIDGTEATLAGKTVGTLTGPSLEDALRERFGDTLTLSIYDSMDAAALDLSAGRVDAVYGDQLQLLHGYVMAEPASYAIVGEPVPFGEGKGIVIRKGETELAQRMTDALAAIVANGQHAEISTKYFGQPLQITN